AQFLGRNAARNIGIKDFQEVAELFAFRFFAELFKSQKRFLVLIEVIDKGDRIKSQICTRKIGAGPVAFDLSALNLIDGRAPKRLSRFTSVTSMPHRPDVS